MPEFDYALIIPAWNESEFIQSCIESTKKAMAGISYSGQLIVVDNNSTDDTASLASNAGAKVVFEPVNQISRARNAGAGAADASMYVFVDADSHICAALLGLAVDAVLNQNKVGGGANIRTDRPVGFAARSTVNSWNWISRHFKLAAGCFVYCRADAFSAVGGFSLKRYAGEELDLSRALKRWGRSHNKSFLIITEITVETSTRKMDWYTHGQLFRQLVLALLPGALNSKRFMRTWYDESTQRTKDKE